MFFTSNAHNPNLPPFPTRRSSDLAFLPAARRGELVAARLGDAAQPVSWGADDPFVEGGTDFWLDGVRVECWLRGSRTDRKSTRLNSSHSQISYAVFCLKKKKTKQA